MAYYVFYALAATPINKKDAQAFRAYAHIDRDNRTE